MTTEPKDVAAALVAITAEVLQLRFGVKLPVHPASPSAVLDALLDVRGRLDRIEELLTRVLRIAGIAQQNAAVATASVDDAWDRNIHRLRTAPTASGGDYSSARERYAEANLAVLDLRFEARAQTVTARHCETTLSVVRTAHRGLDTVRQDLRTWLDGLRFEAHLDR